MSKRVRLFFDRKKKATKDVAGAVEIVICLQRERTYIYSGIRVFKDQWKDGAIVKHPRAVPLNEDLQSQIEKYEKILIAMEVNGDEMRIRNFKSYLTYDGGIRRNFMPWMRERIENRILREGTRRGHMTTYNALMRFGRFKTFDDLTTENIYAFDIFIREEKTFTNKGKPIIRNQAAIHNYHKRFKSYVNEAFRLGLIRNNPYNRLIDKLNTVTTTEVNTRKRFKNLTVLISE